MSKKICKNFALPKAYCNFPVRDFSGALSYLLSSVVSAKKLLPSVLDENPKEVQRKIYFDEHDWELFQNLKNILGLEHDRDLVFLTMRVAKNNPLYS